MNVTLLLLMNFLLIAMENASLYLIGCCFFQCRYSGWKRLLSFLALFAFNVAVYRIAQGRTGLKFGLLIVLTASWLALVFRPHIVKCLAVSMLFLSFLVVGDSIFLTGFRWITGQDAQVILQNPYAYYAFCYFIKIFELAAILILQLCLRKCAKFQAAGWQDWVRTLMFPAMTILIAVFLMQIYLKEAGTAPQILLCSIVLILTDLLTIFLLDHMDRQQQQLHDYAILKRSVKLEQDNVAAWMQAYTGQRKQTHEFQNQLSVIRGLAQQEAPEGELIRYVNRLLQTDFSDSLFVKTGRPVVDVILNQKNAISQNKHIRLYVQLDDLTDFALSDTDLVVILSNLIDNAIEACEKIEDARQRIIRLHMQAKPEVNFLYMENPTVEPVRIVDNMVFSTKEDHLAHGYGLKNVAAILRQYDAIYALDYQEDRHMFCFCAQILPPGQ